MKITACFIIQGQYFELKVFFLDFLNIISININSDDNHMKIIIEINFLDFAHMFLKFKNIILIYSGYFKIIKILLVVKLALFLPFFN